MIKIHTPTNNKSNNLSKSGRFPNDEAPGVRLWKSRNQSLIYDREALPHKMHGMSEIPSWPGSKGFFLTTTKKKMDSHK